ncbi:MAG: hypothetical protein K6F09_06905 [Clostridiales bacterium]|nr:hypothetical protein [Clostridiales bacterium]
MKKSLLKVISIICVLSLLSAFAACGGKTEVTDAEAVTEAETTKIAEETKETETASPLEDETEAVTETAEETTEETTEAEKKVPETKEEILAAYTEIMNLTKEKKPAFTKAEWQDLPDGDGNRSIVKHSGILPVPKLIEAALNVVNNNYVVTEEKAKAEPEHYDKGTDMYRFPVYDTPKGCMLTDVSAIKSASAEQLDNGNIKLVITLKDEKNPEPAEKGATTAPSNTGKMFSPLSKKKQIDPELQKGFVKAVVKDAVYDLIYTNCRAELIYNPETSEVVSLKQYTSTIINGTGKLVGCDVDIMQVVNDTLEAWDFKY